MNGMTSSTFAAFLVVASTEPTVAISFDSAA